MRIKSIRFVAEIHLYVKMEKIKKAISEIDDSFRKVDIFFVILKGLVILMAFYFSLYITGLNPYLAAIPAIIYLFSSLVIEPRSDNVRKVEQKYPELDEKLRTARDYSNKDSVVLKNLEEEVVHDLKGVSLSSFFFERSAIILSIMLIILVSSSVYVSSRNLQLLDFSAAVESTLKRFQDKDEKIEQADFTGGDISVLEIGNEKIVVEINPVGLDFDFSEAREIGDYDFSTSFPSDILISSGAAYESEFNEEQQILIKRYFDRKKVN